MVMWNKKLMMNVWAMYIRKLKNQGQIDKDHPKA